MNAATMQRVSRHDLTRYLMQVLAEAPAEMAGNAVDFRFWETALLDPAHEILRRPGKEFRSQLFESSWVLGGGSPGEHPQGLQLAVELLHVGSLVIDDIEDNSRTRRGGQSLHRRFGIPVALNTGNWLYFLPMAMLPRLGLSAALTLQLFTDIANAVVLCHQGQALDLAAPIANLPQADVPRLVAQATQLKTGSLMRLAAIMGARAGGAVGEQLEALARFGTQLGLGLQMLDDWSGIAVAARREKGIEDIRLGRPTWPWAWLAERADAASYATLARDTRRMRTDTAAASLIDKLHAHLHTTAPDEIRRHLHTSVGALRSALGPSAAMDDLAQQVERLMNSYG